MKPLHFLGRALNEARKVIINAVINADETLGPKRSGIRGTAGDQITRPLSNAEKKDLQYIRNVLLPEVRNERLNGIDLGDEQEPFGFRDITNVTAFPNGLDDIESLDRMNPGPEKVWKVLGPFNNSFNNPPDGLYIGTNNIYFVVFEGSSP